jgi:uncharacterized protein Yka (UPF0111/DUF47 family)
MKFLNFLPNEKLFYNLISELAKQANASSQALHAYVQYGDATRQPMSDARLAAKQALRTLIEEICRAFITPFDREDLQELAEALYRISGMVDTIQQRMHVHHLHSLDGDFQRMTQICVHQGEHLVALIEGLNRNEKASILQEKVTVLYDLEDQADKTALELEHNLFKHDPIPDALNLIVRKDLYQNLENVTDAFRDVAAIALRIILKHS